MTIAYIVYPDVCLDCLVEDGENTTYSRLFLSELLKERWRVCTLETKNFKSFIADYHWKELREIVIYLLNLDKITLEEINIIQTIMASLDREGIEGYPYAEKIAPILDLAKEKADSYDVIIVCNNPTISQNIKGMMKNSNLHYNNYKIMTAKDCYINLINK